MPEHFHILITPSVTLERAVQKGGFSFRVKKELRSAFQGSLKDEVPQWLKPLQREQPSGAPKGAPLQKQIPRFARDDNSDNANGSAEAEHSYANALTKT
jgi:hypothetical protein